MATVKNVKEKILFMENCVRNLKNLQDCIFNHKKRGDDDYYVEAVAALEDEAGLNIHLDTLCFNVKEIIEKEIGRLENIIDNAVVNEE